MTEYAVYFLNMMMEELSHNKFLLYEIPIFPLFGVIIIFAVKYFHKLFYPGKCEKLCL